MRLIAQECVDHIVELLGSVYAIQNKTFAVYDQDTILDIAAEITVPSVGVLYEGMISKGDSGRTGLSTELYCGIIILIGDKNEEIRGKTDRVAIATILDQMRNAIKHQISPTKHKWEYMLETPLDISHNGMGYYMKWKTTAILT